MTTHYVDTAFDDATNTYTFTCQRCNFIMTYNLDTRERVKVDKGSNAAHAGGTGAFMVCAVKMEEG